MARIMPLTHNFGSKSSKRAFQKFKKLNKKHIVKQVKGKEVFQISRNYLKETTNLQEFKREKRRK